MSNLSLLKSQEFANLRCLGVQGGSCVFYVSRYHNEWVRSHSLSSLRTLPNLQRIVPGSKNRTYRTTQYIINNNIKHGFIMARLYIFQPVFTPREFMNHALWTGIMDHASIYVFNTLDSSMSPMYIMVLEHSFFH